jgi:hypothetical protein
MFRTFNISDTMRPYVIQVLERDNIPYSLQQLTITVPLTGNKFRVVMEDALCEKQRDGSVLPVYSFRTLQNPQKFNRLRELNNKKGFYILERDRKKFENWYA